MAKWKRSWIPHLHELRRRDLSIVFNKVPKKFFNSGLEIGAGDGYQSTLLKNYFKTFFSSEVDEKRHSPSKGTNSGYIVCDAQYLPFKNKCFDLIFSSNVFEHILDKEKALNNMMNCLKDNGLMIHILPNRIWKLLQVLLYYPALLEYFFRVFLCRKREKKGGDVRSNSEEIRLNSRFDISKIIFPRIHGSYRSNLDELKKYSKNSWIDFFNKYGCRVETIKKLTLSSGYGFNLNKLRGFGERLGLCSTFAYLISKKNYNCPYLELFS